MALKISNDIVINDDAQIVEGSITKNITIDNWDSATSNGSFHRIDTGAAHYIKQTPPTITYSSGQANFLFFDTLSDRKKDLPNNFIMEIPGRSGVNGHGPTVTSIGFAIPSGFTPGLEATDFDISIDGKHWYISHDGESRVKYYSNTVPWGVSTTSYVGFLDTSGQFTGGGVNLRISEDGYWFYVLKLGIIYQYKLSTPYNLTTAVFDTSISAVMPSPVPVERNTISWFEFRRDGKKLLCGNKSPAFSAGSNATAVLDLSVPWDLSSTLTVESWNSSTLFSENHLTIRLDPDYKRLRSYQYTLVNIGFSNTYEWKTPWYIDSNQSNTFESKKAETASGYNLLSGFTDFKLRPGGHHMVYLFRGTANDRLYKYNFQDSAGAVIPESYTFPPYVHFENGAAPDFPLSGETLYLEFITPDSGDTYYAKELHRD